MNPEDWKAIFVYFTISAALAGAICIGMTIAGCVSKFTKRVFIAGLILIALAFATGVFGIEWLNTQFFAGNQR